MEHSIMGVPRAKKEGLGFSHMTKDVCKNENIWDGSLKNNVVSFPLWRGGRCVSCKTYGAHPLV